MRWGFILILRTLIYLYSDDDSSVPAANASKSIWTCLFTWKTCLSAGFSAFQASNYCFRPGCCGLSDIFMSLAGICSALGWGWWWEQEQAPFKLPRLFGMFWSIKSGFNWVGVFTPSRYPWARWEQNDGSLSEQMKIIVCLLERWKEPGLVLRVLTKVSRIWINTDSRVMPLEVISVSDESSYSALPPVPSLVWQIKKKHHRYFNKTTERCQYFKGQGGATDYWNSE